MAGCRTIDVRHLVRALAAIRLTDRVWAGEPSSTMAAEDCLRMAEIVFGGRDGLESSPVLFAEAFAAHFVKAGRGTIAIIGSVAGDVTRRANYLYGASKALLTRYAQGLDHRLIGSGVKVVLIKPGPTDTPMTAQLKAAGRRMAPVEDVARATVEGIRRGKAVVYTPLLWQLIMLIVRHIPRPIFNRLPL